MKNPRKILQGFTIIETIITTIIIALLIGVIFQIFVMTGRIAVFIQQQRQVHNEMIYVIQIIQNLVDDQSIVLDEYDFAALSGNLGYTSSLRFIDEDSGQEYWFSKVCGDDGCYINLFKPDLIAPVFSENIILTNPNDVEIHDLNFKILPFQVEEDFETTMHDGFWMFIDARSPMYNKDERRYRVYYRGQLFFNQRKY